MLSRLSLIRGVIMSRITRISAGEERLAVCVEALLVLYFVCFTLFGQHVAAAKLISEAAAAQVAEPSQPGALATKTVSIETKAIDGHSLINPYDVLVGSGRPQEKFSTLHQERLWAVAKLDQERSEIVRLLSMPHRRPIPVPEVSDQDYRTRVADIEGKTRTYEAAQNNNDLTESQRAEAHAQLLDLTRQKARAGLEFAAFRNYQLQEQEYDNVTKSEEAAKAIATDTLAYLSKIDDAIGQLLEKSDSEGFFRLQMGIGFLGLVTLLIIGFFVVGSRSGSMRDILRNDRGLQFITLFSLVIAITMFGLLNILEGKELSALLGGLSGYILGRSNLGGSSDTDVKA
jgi:hypothetical protein